jgi:hypothetical protein
MKKKDYYLPGCLVLLATVAGTRSACQWAMEHLPMARRWSAENQMQLWRKRKGKMRQATNRGAKYHV